MRAWFAGDFEQCLALCDRVRPHGIALVSELALLRARALLRVGRPVEAIQVVSDVFVAHGTLDASLTARMLLGQAYVRAGERERGLAMLLAAYGDAEAAHPTIRSEIALSIGLGYYGLHRFDEAQRALDDVSPDSDIVYARSLEYRGWIAMKRCDFAEASAHFSATLERLDGCRHQDRFMEANAILGLAGLACERLDRHSWLVAERRSERLDWSASGLAGLRHGLALCASKMYEVDGRIGEALAAVREAESLAPNEGYALLARCRRAAIYRSAREPFAHADAAASMKAQLETLDANAWRENEQHGLPLAIAEELAYARDVLGARALLKRYRELPSSPLLIVSGQPFEAAHVTFVEAVIADAEGDHRAAHDRYRAAFHVFNKHGFERRALQAALRLGELTGQAYLFEYVERAVRKLGSASPLRDHARRLAPASADPIVASLAPGERAVLHLLCAGKTTLEIAAARRRSKQTIRNTVSRVLRAFGVGDRPALLRECARRGLLLL
jgi:DNA-binding NarL/FixJ family response regulator